MNNSISISINDLSKLDISELINDYDQISISSDKNKIIHHYNINNDDEFLIISDDSNFLESISKNDLDNQSIEDMIFESLEYLLIDY